MARAYFLAVASIEETGKGLQAFDAQKRNLSDPAVTAKLKVGMGKHAQKINYAFSAWIESSQNAREAIETAIDLMTHLRRGREPSMYSELRTDPDRAQLPRDIVRAEAARDCVSLARDCVAHAISRITDKDPPPVTRAQDRLFTMKSAQFQKILNTADFWWYYLSRSFDIPSNLQGAGGVPNCAPLSTDNAVFAGPG
jgi:AbiV family abortive infection protein